jgi:hypothetical protein
MNNTYSSLEEIWNRYLAGERQNLMSASLNLLSAHGIQMRTNDGELKQITISKPTSVKNTFVLGLRYLKKDASYSEDHFVCQKDQPSALEPIERYYQGKLERKYQEYKGTHKQPSDPALAALLNSNTTEVNTISYFIGEK